MNINIKDYILSINSSFDFGADYVDAFFEEALNLLHENKGGEIYLPNGTYKFSRGIRCTKHQGFDYTNVYPDEVLEFIPTSRISTEYNRIILEITDTGNSTSPAKFRWSKNWGLTWYEENISIPSNGEYVLVGTSINIKFPRLFFREQQRPITFFWTGDGIYPLPYNSKIRGENINNTILEFDFSETVGQGDAIIAVWTPMRNAHEQVEISDLTIKNLSTTNTHRLVQLPASNLLPSVDLKNSLPHKSNGIVFLRINSVIRNGGIYQLQYEFGEKWKNEIGGNIQESRFGWGLSKNMLIDKEIELTGTGLIVKLNDNYENGQTYEYEWITEGYAGAGILCVGDRDVNIKNVSILDFVRSIIIDISLNTIISGCRLYNSIKPNHHIGVWYATNYLSKAEFNNKIVAPPGGGTNLHMIENCIFAGSGVGIWHEDGINHVVKFCTFDSTNICTLLGSTTNIKYESCYYESIVTSFFEHSRKGSVGNFDVSNCTFVSRNGAKLFNLITPEGFAIHLLRIDNCYINSINAEGLIKYTDNFGNLSKP